jgi:hypothetical protein
MVMGRLLGLAAAGVAALAAGGALACGSALAATPPAALTKIACHSTLDPSQRSVSVTSTMRHVPGTESLAVRFTLLESAPGSATKPVLDGDLGHWLTPADPSLGGEPADVWKLTKAVYNVDAPAIYRFRVSFRWLGAGGTILSSTTLSTGRCRARELRPDVLVRSVAVSAVPDRPGRDRYVAVIANQGLTASGPFAVALTPSDGAASQTMAVASLGQGAQTQVTFIAPRCNPTDPPIIVADPAGAVDDYNRSNNTLTVNCPAIGADGR